MSNDILAQANDFKEKFQFHKAIKLLEEISIEEQDSDYFRLKAQCYYQDLKLPTTKRFTKALKLLEIKDDDKPQETLRLKGAIHKRKYDYNRDIKELYQAISFYEKASENKQEDMGYGAGNAVYLYYLLLSELGNTPNLTPEPLSFNSKVKTESYLLRKEKILGKNSFPNVYDLTVGLEETALFPSEFVSQEEVEKVRTISLSGY